MKVLYLTKYTRLGASSRLRSYQYFPFLNNSGISVSVSPLFNDAYLKGIYSGKASVLTVLSAYVKRFFVLFTLFNYDKIVIEKELFPYFPAFFERLLTLMNVHYVVDYDDAIFHNYDLSTNKIVRFFLQNKIGTVMKYAETVLAGNEYLAAKATVSGAKKVVLFSTVIDISRYTLAEKKPHDTIIIGWIGSPSTFKYVKPIFPVFEEMSKKYSIEVHIVGAKENVSVSFPIRFVTWSEETEADSISRFDVGIMPLENSPWEKGKCAYKLIQYMACGIPVVASPVGMNTKVVLPGENGFLADNLNQWSKSLEEIISDSRKCHTFGIRGRQLVEKEYTVQSSAQKLIDILKN